MIKIIAHADNDKSDKKGPVIKKKGIKTVNINGIL